MLKEKENIHFDLASYPISNLEMIIFMYHNY